MKPISTIIVEDRAILRENLSLALENSKDFSVSGHFNEAREALAFFKKSAFDVAIIDYSLPDTNGIRFLREALKMEPFLHGLFLSMYCDGEKILDAFRQGAIGYMKKTSETSELIAAIRQIMNGEPCISPSLKSFLITAMTAQAKAEEHPLSDEHLIILTLAGKGKATKEIAEELGFTIAAVKHRLNEIFSFLECTAESRRCLKL